MSNTTPRSTTMDGESVIMPTGDVFTVGCCDCGLMHKHQLSYDPEVGQVAMLTWRDNDATKKNRRQMKRKKVGLWKDPEKNGV
jgi:hypothetical protein